MSRRRIKKEDKEDVEWEGIQRLVEGIVLHVLDSVAISGKWYPRDIGMKTLLEKRKKLREMGKWMKGWQWDVWVSMYCENKNFVPNIVKKRFEAIRKESTKYVNKRIKQHTKRSIQKETKDK